MLENQLMAEFYNALNASKGSKSARERRRLLTSRVFLRLVVVPLVLVMLFTLPAPVERIDIAATQDLLSQHLLDRRQHFGTFPSFLHMGA